MSIRLARMALVETYENSTHFDLTYLMFVWMAFLPTTIIPWLYGSWVLSRYNTDIHITVRIIFPFPRWMYPSDWKKKFQ